MHHYIRCLSKLDTIKYYIDSHLAKKLIQESSAFYSLPILFIKQPRGEIWFCVDYRRFNIIKKNCYLISFIEETLTQRKGAKYFTKIDIC